MFLSKKAVIGCLGAIFTVVSQGANGDVSEKSRIFTYMGRPLKPINNSQGEPDISKLVISATGARPSKGACTAQQITQIFDGVRSLTYLESKGWVLNQYSTYSVCSDATTGKLSVQISAEVDFYSGDVIVSHWLVETPSTYSGVVDFDDITNSGQSISYGTKKAGKVTMTRS